MSDLTPNEVKSMIEASEAKLGLSLQLLESRLRTEMYDREIKTLIWTAALIFVLELLIIFLHL